MTAHLYNPQQALETLMRKLGARDEMLAAQVQAAIDAGKDVSENQPATDRRKKTRVYRKTVPFSHEEALQTALDALQAYFVEQPLFVESAADSLTEATCGVPKQMSFGYRASSEKVEPIVLEGLGVEKAIEIEMQTETQLSRTGEETIPLKRMPKKQIDEQRHHIADLRKLTKFTRD